MTSGIPASMLIHTATWYPAVAGSSADAHGNAGITFPNGTAITGRFQQDKAAEPVTDGRNATIRNWTLFTNQDGIGAGDRIVFGALTFEVDGPPAPMYGGSGFHHAEVALKLVAG